VEWPLLLPAQRRGSRPHPSGTSTPRNAHRRIRRPANYPSPSTHRATNAAPTSTPLRPAPGVSFRPRRLGRDKSVLLKKKPCPAGKKNRCMPAYSIKYYVMLANIRGKHIASVAEDFRSQVDAQAFALR